MKIMVGVNTLTSIDSLAYSNHCQFWYRLGKNHPDITFALNNPHRASIDRMRNQTAKIALEHDFDYVLFIDDDVLLPTNGLDLLLKADKDIVAGWTIIRGHPFDNMFFRYTGEDKQGLERWKDVDLPVETGVLDCDAVGFSFCLIKSELLKKVPPPWFVTGTHNTEDVYFCVKSRKYNPSTSIAVNLDCVTGHILGSEIIDKRNRKAYSKFFEEIYPEHCEQPKIEARGDNYLAFVKDPSKENMDKFHASGQ